MLALAQGDLLISPDQPTAGEGGGRGGGESLDLGGDTSIAKAREIFGHDFPIDIIPMPADLSADSTEPILNWAKNVIEENAGGILTILYHLEPDYDLETVRALSEFVKTKQ